MQTFKERGVSVVAFIEHWTYNGERYGWRYSGTFAHDVSHNADPYAATQKLLSMWKTSEDRYKLRDRDPFGVETKENINTMSAGQFYSLVRRSNELDTGR